MNGVDIVANFMQDFLQRERLGCAHLDSFASGLELIGQKV